MRNIFNKSSIGTSKEDDTSGIMPIIGCHQTVQPTGNQQMTQKIADDPALSLTGIPKKNKSGTSQTIQDSYINQAALLQGDPMYISNRPLAMPPELKLFAAREIQELVEHLINSGEQATHDELHFVLFMINDLVKGLEDEFAIE